MPNQALYSYLYKFGSDVFNAEKFKEIAKKKGWQTNIAGPLATPVERDILTFDSFAIIAELSSRQMSFGGGTLLNWAYARDRPRFSFDIDSQVKEHGLDKQYILKNLLLFWESSGCSDAGSR